MITVDIRPEAEAELARQAATRGLGTEAYAASLLEAAASASVDPGSFEPKSMLDLFAPLRGLNLEFERSKDLGRDIVL